MDKIYIVLKVNVKIGNKILDIISEINNCEFCNKNMKCSFNLKKIIEVDNDKNIKKILLYAILLNDKNETIEDIIEEINNCEFCNKDRFKLTLINNDKYKTKRLNITMFVKCVGNTGIDVPANLTIKEAIQYAKKHIEAIPTPRNLEYIHGDDIIDEDNCDFNED